MQRNTELISAPEDLRLQLEDKKKKYVWKKYFLSYQKRTLKTNNCNKNAVLVAKLEGVRQEIEYTYTDDQKLF